MNKAIVFGGSGFLGSHVADALSDSGYKVVIFDKRDSVYRKDEQQFIQGDILIAENVLNAVEECDYIFNFAGIADLDDARTNPMATVKLNIEGSINIIEAAIKAQAKRYVYASSIYVYSQKGGFYRCSKQAAELYIEEYHRKYGLEYTVLRYGTLYGPRADARNGIFGYIKQALESGKIDYSGDGHEIREYINVRDAANLSLKILEREYANKHIALTGHNPMRFRDMILMIEEILGKKIKINYSGSKWDAHYRITPYSYAPKTGYKLASDMYLDMGQGLLECISEIDEQIKHNNGGKNGEDS